MTTTRLFFIPKMMSVGFMSLSACVPNLPNFAQDKPQTRMHALAEGQIIVQAPSRFCVDESARASDKFVLLTNCDVLSKRPSSDPSERGVITVSTGGPLPASAGNLSVQSALGATAEISDRVEGLTIQRADKESAPRLPGADAKHWRGVMQLNNRIVTIAVYGPTGGDVLGDQGKTILENAAFAIQQASPEI